MSGGWMGGAEGWMHGLVTMELKGVALLALCALGALALRRGSAAGRHWLWLLGTLGLLALPFGQALLPRWSTPVPSWTGVGASSAALRSTTSISTSAPPSEHGTASGGSGSDSSVGTGTQPTGSRNISSQATGPAALPSGAATTTPRPDPLPVAFLPLGIWMLGSLLLLGALVRSVLAARRLASRSTDMPPGEITATARALAGRLGLRRRVRVVQGGPHAMPMSWGWLRPVILLPAGVGDWPRGRLEAVLLHELAHVRRADCLTQIVAEMALALHWVNPLAWLAARRLRREREYACDDVVLAAGAQASEYADELLGLARGLRPARGTALAAVAMARPAHLCGRLHAVLDATRRRGLGRMGALGAALATAVVAGTLASADPAPAQPAPSAPDIQSPKTDPTSARPGAPTHVPASTAGSVTASGGTSPEAAVGAPQVTTCGFDTEGWENVSSHSDTDRGLRELRWSKPGCRVDVRIEGDVRFSSDFTEVAGLGHDDLLRIEETDGRTERRLDVTAGEASGLRFEYRVDGDERPFDASARAWYQGMIVQIFRRTGFMASERVAALLRQGGTARVLQELDHLPSDFVFAKYTQELIRQGDVSDDQALDLVKRARSRVDSDYYLSSILEAFAKTHLRSDAMVDEYLAAAATIDSDHYRTGVLQEALGRGSLSPEQVAAVLSVASGLDSDYYLSQILTGVADQYALAPALRTTYLDAVSSIESDTYRSRVLGALLDRNDLSADEMAEVLRAVGGVKSDTYVAKLLGRVADKGLTSDALLDAYLDIVGGIESDTYRAGSLGKLLEARKLSDDQLPKVIRAAGGIRSDHYKAQVLLDVIDAYDLEGPTRQALLDVMNTIESEHYRGRVAERLLRK